MGFGEIDGQRLSGLTEIAASQQSLFAALDLPQPTPPDLAKPQLYSAILMLIPYESGTYVSQVSNSRRQAGACACTKAVKSRKLCT